MSVDQTPEDNAAEAEAVLSLQETADSKDLDVEAHDSNYSVLLCTGTGGKTKMPL
ncbi:hypothetical protein [Kitasatospora griseola]|uniref:hypothetical protein n=1 Tax=Kitasatospora griseola TaxID=2064 RepID=UPI003651A94E